MKIVIHDFAAHPFVFQLSKELAKKGFTVYHLHSTFFQSPNQGNINSISEISNLILIPVEIGITYSKTNFVKRRKADILYGKVVSDKIKEIKPNIFINCVSPLDSSQLIRKACRDMGVKYLTWLQDVYSIATSKVLSNKYSLFGRLIGKYYEFVEAQLLRSSDHIISITKDFVPLLTSWNVKSENISVIPNWANVNEIPFGGKVNPWSIQYDLYDKFCFLYSGTLGFKHNPRILSELALNVIKYSNIKVVVISEGQGADWLNKEKRDKKIQNLIILNFQSFKELPNVLATSDVLISILELEAGLYSVPSKVLTYLCSKRPLLLAVPADNMAARMVLENDMGIVVPPDDDKLFIEAALELYQNEEKRELYGNNARAYAEENFDIKSITNNFIDILDTCITGFKNN